MISLPWKNKKNEFPIVRVDDRLLHGQVVVGWVAALALDRLIVANDRLISDKALCAALRAGVSADIRVDILELDGAVAGLSSGDFASSKSMLVLESPGDVLKLIHKGVTLKTVHIGGLHFREGSDELLPYVYLSNWDRMALDEMVERGVRVSCQDLPATTPVVYRG